MKLSCPSCGAKYSIADEKVQDRLAKIRCRKCSATIIVDGKVSPPNVYTSDAGTPATNDVADHGSAIGAGEYSVDFGDNDQRTMTADDIVAAFRRGEVTYDTYVWADGMTDWSPISAVPDLSQALSSAAAAPVAAPVPAPVAEVPRQAAARSGAGRGSAHDLFGGIERAGGEDEVMTSAAAAAPAPAAPAPVAATGARNESSVLFSLSALTASSGPAAAPAATTSGSGSDKSDHDSGLIDLKALASSAATSQAPASPIMLGTAPLGMAAPLGGITAPAVAAEMPMMPKAQSKTGLIVAAILFGFVLIAGAVFMALNKEAPAAAPAAVAPVVSAPVAATPEPKKEEPTATPPATGTASAEPAKTADTKTASASAAAPKAAGGASRKKASSSSGGAAAPAPAQATEPAPAAEPAAAAAPKPKAAPKKSSCNCAPGDLMCAMKCASGGG